MEKRTRRFPVMLSESEASEIEQFRWANRIGSQAEALRTLVKRGLVAAKNEKASEVLQDSLAG